MAYGDGSIKKLGKDHYEVRVDFDEGNKRRQVKRRIHGPRSMAVKLRDKLRQQSKNGIKLDGGKITLTEMIEDWKRSRELAGKASQRTINSERRALRHIEAHLGDEPINTIDSRAIERTYAAVKEETGLSGTTMKQIHYSLKAVFNKAMDYDYILRNPCDRVTAPSRCKSDRNALSAQEGARLLKCIDVAESETYEKLFEKEQRQHQRGNDEDRSCIQGLVILSYIVAVRIALATGMRRGEVFGLTWEALDLSQDTLSVFQSLTDEGNIKEPKTDAGYRTIGIDQETVAHLRKWKAFQALLLRTISINQDNSSPICCSNTGGFVGLSNFEHWWIKFRTKHGFKGLRFHELRHTQATQLLANGIDLRTVKDRLGHSNAAVTMGYTHQVPENDEKAAALIGNLFSSGLSAKRKEENNDSASTAA